MVSCLTDKVHEQERVVAVAPPSPPAYSSAFTMSSHPPPRTSLPRAPQPAPTQPPTQLGPLLGPIIDQIGGHHHLVDQPPGPGVRRHIPSFLWPS